VPGIIAPERVHGDQVGVLPVDREVVIVVLGPLLGLLGLAVQGPQVLEFHSAVHTHAEVYDPILFRLGGLLSVEAILLLVGFEGIAGDP
jgi:hypothetical protein